ncbi:hypothetical protein FGB90_10195 [Alteribacter natronophilus]|nr:hypothetical protein FGB90_10195 [Alteribacter natronophilus]
MPAEGTAEAAGKSAAAAGEPGWRTAEAGWTVLQTFPACGCCPVPAAALAAADPAAVAAGPG